MMREIYKKNLIRKKYIISVIKCDDQCFENNLNSNPHIKIGGNKSKNLKLLMEIKKVMSVMFYRILCM